MFETLSLNKKQIYPALVVSTMSSGKSTLINAIMGRELLPSRHTACTTRVAAVLDNDAKPQFGIHAVKGDGTYCFREYTSEKDVSDFNKANHVEEMMIEGDIRGIRNNRKALLLVDTPGLNYCMDQSHERVTKEALDEYFKEFQEGLILYVINAQQMGVNDEIDGIKLIVGKLKENPKFKVIFVINKMDTLDPAKENPGTLVINCRKEIQKLGIEEPFLIPVSAASALLFKKVINRQPLSFTDNENFEHEYKRFQRSSFSLEDYVDIPGCRNMGQFLTLDGRKYTYAEIYAALGSTGLPFLERKIDKILSDAPKVEEPKVIVKKFLGKKSAESVENKLKSEQVIEYINKQLAPYFGRQGDKEKTGKKVKNNKGDGADGKGTDQV